MKDELNAVPRVVEEDVEGGTEGCEGSLASKGKIDRIGGVLLSEELGTFADMGGITQEGAKGKEDHAQGNIKNKNPQNVFLREGCRLEKV